MAGFHNADATVAARKAVSVTASDATIFEVCRALYIGTGGNLAVRMSDGTAVTFTNVAAGIFPIQVDMVKAAGSGTTASGIIALY
jgi:hypothetical protein